MYSNLSRDILKHELPSLSPVSITMTFSLNNDYGTREITRLDLMAYLDPASNPGSKPQRLGATNFKSSTSDKL